MPLQSGTSLFLHHADADPCLDASPTVLAEPSHPVYDPLFPLTDYFSDTYHDDRGRQ